MPRLLINGFPETKLACFVIKVNAAAKGSGAQQKILFNKSMLTKEGIIEIPLAKNYLGTSIRLLITIPGFLTIDKNIILKTNTGYISLSLIKQTQPDIDLLEDSYKSVKQWQNIQPQTLYNEAVSQFKMMLAQETSKDRNAFLGALAIVLAFCGFAFMISGIGGVLVVVIFSFYFNEKNKHNRWSDITK